MSKLVIYLIIGAVILIYNWIAGAMKEHARRQEARDEENDRRSVAMSSQPGEDPWAVFERNMAQNRTTTARAEVHIGEARRDDAMSHIREAEQPRNTATAKAEKPKPRKKTRTSAAAEEGKRVTNNISPETTEALEAERRRNAALRAHYDRWRQAMVDRQVLEQKF